jgi:hypothetical protein
MLLLRFMALTFIVIAAALVAFALDAAWAVVLAVLIMLAALVELFVLIMHYTSAAEQAQPSDEITLEDEGLVERETGLPTRRRWNEPQAREYADEVARRGLVAVPDGWRGPEGAHRVLLVTTGTLAPQRLRQALSDVSDADDLAVLVVVPTLARDAAQLRRGDASEPVAHAEAIARETVAALEQAGIRASGHIGPADPAVAVSDGLRTFAAQRVVVARHQAGAVRYLENVDTLEAAAAAFEVPLQELDLDAPASAAGR